MHFERTPEWLANYIEDPGVLPPAGADRHPSGLGSRRPAPVEGAGGVEACDTGTPLKWAAQAKALGGAGLRPDRGGPAVG